MRDKFLGVLLLVVLGLVGCGTPSGPSEPQRPVEVSQSVGNAPVVHIDTPLPLAEASSELIVRGDGPALTSGAPALLALTAYDGTTGDLLPDRGHGESRTIIFSEEEVGEEIYSRLLGVPEGSRVLVMQPVTGEEGDHMLVLVIDVMHTQAQGEARELPEDFPDVEVADDDDLGPQISLPEDDPPDELLVAPLIQGSGPQVGPAQDVTLQYSAVVWPGGEVYDSTWADGQVPRTIAIDDAFPGLRDGLLDRAVGSRMVLIIPPELATGTNTLVFVVDILAANDPN
ncbi:MAG TPA: FKBP-type peptidyl-prolyl cis-trans isomerase [Actinomycetaceae bacterium]|nr:FKBP-type peptidyl-prolyl cis-trans isomerase [Actinomycetaceae bacterium]